MGTLRANSKLTPERHRKMIEYILQGNSKSVAATLVGVHKDTLFDWLRYARQELASGEVKHPEYVELLNDIAQAEALVESQLVAQVQQAALNGTWQAAAWWLERRRPKDWGKNPDVLVAHEKPQQQVNILILEDSNARETSRELLRRIAGLGSGGANVAVGPGPVRESTEDAA